MRSYDFYSCEITFVTGVYAHTTAVCVLQSVPPGAIV